MTLRVLFLSALLLGSTHAYALQTVTISAGDIAGLIDAIHAANQSEEPTRIEIVAGPNGETDFIFTEGVPGTGDKVLPHITSNITIAALDPGILFKTPKRGYYGEFGLVVVEGDEGKAELHISGLTIEGFYEKWINGGAITVLGDSKFSSKDVTFLNNYAGNGGAAVAIEQTATAHIVSNRFIDNITSSLGGALIAENESSMKVERSYFSGNSTLSRACDIANRKTAQLEAFDNVFDSACENRSVDTQEGLMTLRGNTFSHAVAGLSAEGPVTFFSNLFNEGNVAVQVQAGTRPSSKIENSCRDLGGAVFVSLGYNISWDDSCFLGQPTDRSDTDPMLADNDDGLPVPAPGSPAIDAGMSEVIVFEGDTLASLPCPYRDLSGVARPQDGNNDGIYECDAGAMEVTGNGQVEAGHSGAFFNPGRTGEGTFVEILENNRAIVYTFSYRPDGSGQSWFIGNGEIAGNSIIVPELLRPVGTRFGADFNTDDIEYTPLGSMNIVVPDCALTAPGASVAYTGMPDEAYEALLTRSVRLSEIASCGTRPPSPKAGLSGTYFDPRRNGEGIIVEWMTNGDVLVIFFTYDLDNNQLWLIAQGTPVGNSVTLAAQYASAFTEWGSGFDVDELSISPWGTITLTWNGCNAVKFDYSSTVAGYGSGSHNYTRLSMLDGTTCPDF